MKIISVSTLLLMFISTALSADNRVVISDEQYLNDGRAVAKAFQSQLGLKLKQAMKTGGPISAIRACNVSAQPIAGDVGKIYNVDVRRVSDRARNPKDIPDELDSEVLRQFSSELGDEKVKLPERLVYLRSGHVRYYKAIKVQGLCLSCHGRSLDPQVSQQLKVLYPGDQAVGYQMGDLRGAFVVSF